MFVVVACMQCCRFSDGRGSCGGCGDGVGVVVVCGDGIDRWLCW